MKESRYNYFFQYDGKDLAFNSMTCAFAEIDNDFYQAMQAVRQGESLAEMDKELLKKMEEGGYIIDDCADELRELRFRNMNGKFQSQNLGLTIAPTLSCNFACPYCYEDRRVVFMDTEVQDGIVRLVQRTADHHGNISVTWYGGEPLLAKDTIQSLSERIIPYCDERGVSYDAFIVTNGYLITEETGEWFKKMRINGAQITIDGAPEIHNTRRKLKGSSAPTFDRIIEGVRILLKHDIPVDIRVNVDKTNIDGTEKLLGIPRDKGLTDCDINFGHVTAYTEACNSVADTCLDMDEYAEHGVRLQKVLRDLGFRSEEYPMYPGIKGNYCCADSLNAFVVDPEGYFYKCWNDIGQKDKSVGKVQDVDGHISALQQSVLEKYMLWTPFDHEECVDCFFLPNCMGGCPYNGEFLKGNPECEKWKDSMNDILKEVYDHYRETSAEQAV
ncbi:MAG: radical SAM protein [Bulleidia sp.]